MGLGIATHAYAVGSYSLTYGTVPWDSEIFGFTVIEAAGFSGGNGGGLAGLLRAFDGKARSLGGRVICAKTPAERPELLYELQRHGYTFIEETVRPRIGDLQSSDYRLRMGAPLIAATRRELGRISDIACRSFRHDRFHRDPRFGGTGASRRYFNWVRNSFDAGEDVSYLSVAGEPAGFAIISLSGDKAYLELIGLDDGYKGKGLGAGLFAAACQRAKDMGAREFATTVSLNNLPALNLYALCGFRFEDPMYVLHKWLW